MTLLEKLIFVFLCFAIAAGALVWIARIRQARIEGQQRADFARPSARFVVMRRWRRGVAFDGSDGADEFTGLHTYEQLASARLEEMVDRERMFEAREVSGNEPLIGKRNAVPDLRSMAHPQGLSDREAQRRSFEYGNASISNPNITRADIDRAALAEHLRTTPGVDEWLAARGDDEVTEVAR